MLKFFRYNLAPTFPVLPMVMKMSNAVATTEKVGNEDSLKRSNSDPVVENSSKKVKIDTEHVKKKKVALVLGYCGQGYLGLQRNPGMKTVEEDIMNALLKSGLINNEVFETAQLIQFQRAARTDKGVSALRQILSLKLPLDADIASINQHLPEQIRIFGMKRVTKGFNSKNSCDSRTYSYTCPSFAFAPSNVTPSEEYRIDAETLSKVNGLLKMYQGTRNYYNFTSRRRPNDPSCVRYMKNVNCEEPYEREGLELVQVVVRGQSFMLHQIRKMVGLVIAIARGLTTKETMEKAWQSQKLDIPIAPGLGLILEQVHYDTYNKRYGKDGIHSPLDWVEFENEIKEFKEKILIPHIIKTEKEEKSMLNYILETLPMHSFDPRESTQECDGLMALGEAADIIESNENSTDHLYLNDNLNTLAQAAQSVSPEKVKTDENSGNP